MPDTTSRLGAAKPIVGETNWGPTLRSGLDTIDAGVALLGHNHAAAYAALVHSHGSVTLPWFDVTAYGAVGDGTADDTAAIQAALDAVGANGGIVFLPAGRYKTTATLRIEKDCTTLMGVGPGERLSGTQLTAASRIEPSTAVTGSAVRVQRVADDRPVLGVTLRDFCVESQQRGTAVDGILYRSNRGLIHNVAVWRATGHGLHMKGYSGWGLYETRVFGVQVGDCSLAGIYCETRAEDMHFASCISFHNKYGIQVAAASQQISGCHFYDNTENNIFFNGGGTRSKVIGCKIEGAPKHSVVVDGTTGGISELQFVGNGFCTHTGLAGQLAANNTYDHLFVTGGANWADRITIVGNQFKHQTMANGFKYRSGVNLSDATSSLCTVVGNTFGDNGDFATQQLISVPTGTVVVGNTNGGTENDGTATVASGATTAVVSHGLDFTPALQDVMVTATNNLGNATKFWISTVTSTQFTINVNTDPGATTATFVWRARVF